MEDQSTTNPTNYWLTAAGVVMMFSTGLHVFAGGVEIYDPVRASTMDPVPRSVASVVWHIVTAYLFLSAIAHVWLSRQRCVPLELFLIALHITTAIIFLIYTFKDFGDVFALPQWTLFVVTAAFGGVALLQGTGRTS